MEVYNSTIIQDKKRDITIKYLDVYGLRVDLSTNEVLKL